METAPAPAQPPSLFRRLKTVYDARAPVRWMVDLGLFILILSGVGLWQTRAHVHGGPVPAFTLPTLGTGAQVSSATLTGKPTMLAFWAPWCGVCEAESSNVGWAQRLVGERATILSVATAYTSTDQVTAYTQRNKVDYPVLLDDGTLAEQLKISSFPTVYFLDERGHIKGSVAGYSTTFGLLLRTLW